MYTAKEKVYNNARRLLLGGTFLITIHFIVQYLLHKPVTIDAETRSIINMLFGIPFSAGFGLSLLLLQRKGRIELWEWLISPVTFLLSIIVLMFSHNTHYAIISRQQVITTIAVLYSTTLLFYVIQQLIEYGNIKKVIAKQKDFSLEPLIRWTQWSMFLLMISGFCMPFMIVCDNLLARGIFGIFSISVAFFYAFSFIGYGLNCYNIEDERKNLIIVNPVKPQDNANTDNPAPKDDQVSSGINYTQIEAAVKVWSDNKGFLRPNLTVNKVSEEIGVPRPLFTAWLRTTEHFNFSDWLNFLRIEEAKEMLIEHPKWTNETVAKSCGFGDRSYFQRKFRDIVGTTPSKWIEDYPTEQSTEKKENEE